MLVIVIKGLVVPRPTPLGHRGPPPPGGWEADSSRGRWNYPQPPSLC